MSEREVETILFCVIGADFVVIWQLENFVRIGANDLEPFRRIFVVKLGKYRRGFDAWRAVGEPEVHKVRLSGILRRCYGLSVICSNRESRCFFSFKASDRSFNDSAELWTSLDLLDIDLGNFARLCIALHKFRHSRVRLHDSEDHISLTRHVEIELL